jgi:hypothetical protein
MIFCKLDQLKYAVPLQYMLSPTIFTIELHFSNFEAKSYCYLSYRYPSPGEYIVPLILITISLREALLYNFLSQEIISSVVVISKWTYFCA